MSYVDFASGAAVGLLVCVVAISYDRVRKDSNRIIPVEARHRRTLDQEAVALAFATLYKRYADGAYPHFVLPEDRELVTAVVKNFVRENRDKLGEMYFGPTFFERDENELVTSTVDRAVELFIQI